MKKAIPLFIAGLLIFPMSSCSISSTADSGAIAGQSIHLRGSETVMGMLQNAAESYMRENPGVTICISGGGTDRGIKSLIDGTCQIAMSSAEPNGELKNRATAEGIELSKNVIAYDGIVPFVHPDNPVSNLTIDQLKKIYTGQIVNWKDVGGNDSEIVLTTQNLGSGTYEGFRLLVIGSNAILPPNAVQMDSIPERDFVAQNTGAIGYCALNYIDDTVKAVSVGGIPAGTDTIADQSFPLTRDLILYTRVDASTEVARFIDYIISNGSRFAQPGVLPVEAKAGL